MQVIFGHRWRHLVGEADFWEHVGGIDIFLAPSSFGQANTRVTKASDSKEREKKLYYLIQNACLKFLKSVIRERGQFYLKYTSI